MTTPDHTNHPDRDPLFDPAVLLYRIIREAGTPYLPPDFSEPVQLHVDRDTWRIASAWFRDVTESPFPPTPPDPGTDDDDQTITPAALDFLCSELHNAYERAAKQTGWNTQEVSRVHWNDLPSANQNTMRLALAHVLFHLGIHIEIQDNGSHNQ